MTIKDYHEEAIIDTTIDQTDLTAYMLRIGLLRAKWARYYAIEDSIKDSIDIDLSEKYRERFMYYTQDSPVIIDKKSLDSVIKCDEEYLKVKRKLLAQEKVVKFINEILSALSGMSYIMNTTVKNMIFRAGESA